MNTVSSDVVIFWDMENMALWKRFPSTKALVTTISTILHRRTISRITGIGALSNVCNAKRLAEMQRHGIQTVDCSLGHRNAADIVITTEMMRAFVEFRPKTMCLISNDVGFAHVVSTLRQLGCDVVVMHDQPNILLSRITTSIDLRPHYASFAR